jgi:hypothetical protein
MKKNQVRSYKVFWDGKLYLLQWTKADPDDVILCGSPSISVLVISQLKEKSNSWNAYGHDRLSRFPEAKPMSMRELRRRAHQERA